MKTISIICAALASSLAFAGTNGSNLYSGHYFTPAFFPNITVNLSRTPPDLFVPIYKGSDYIPPRAVLPAQTLGDRQYGVIAGYSFNPSTPAVTGVMASSPEIGGSASRVAQLHAIEGAMKAVATTTSKSAASALYYKTYYRGLEQSYVAQQVEPRVQSLAIGPMQALLFKNPTATLTEKRLAEKIDVYYRRYDNVSVATPGEFTGRLAMDRGFNDVSKLGLMTSVTIFAPARIANLISADMSTNDGLAQTRLFSGKTIPSGTLIFIATDGGDAAHMDKTLAHEGFHAGINAVAGFAYTELATIPTASANAASIANRNAAATALAAATAVLDHASTQIPGNPIPAGTYADSVNELGAYVTSNDRAYLASTLADEAHVTPAQAAAMIDALADNQTFKDLMRTTNGYATQLIGDRQRLNKIITGNGAAMKYFIAIASLGIPLLFMAASPMSPRIAGIVADIAKVQAKIDSGKFGATGARLLTVQKTVLENYLSSQLLATSCASLYAYDPTMKSGAYILYPTRKITEPYSATCALRSTGAMVTTSTAPMALKGCIQGSGQGCGSLSAQPLKEVYDGIYYLKRNPDVDKLYAGDLDLAQAHWETYGIAQGRQASLGFYSVEYLKMYPELAKQYGATGYAAAMKHYLIAGIPEGRVGRFGLRPEVFDATWYVQNNADLKALFGNDLNAATEHWLNHGINQGRQGSADFSATAYLKKVPSLAAAYPGANKYEQAIIHFIMNEATYHPVKCDLRVDDGFNLLLYAKNRVIEVYPWAKRNAAQARLKELEQWGYCQ